MNKTNEFKSYGDDIHLLLETPFPGYKKLTLSFVPLHQGGHHVPHLLAAQLLHSNVDTGHDEEIVASLVSSRMSLLSNVANQFTRQRNSHFKINFDWCCQPPISRNE